jgi:hypothetical protein
MRRNRKRAGFEIDKSGHDLTAVNRFDRGGRAKVAGFADRLDGVNSRKLRFLHRVNLTDDAMAAAGFGEPFTAASV